MAMHDTTTFGDRGGGEDGDELARKEIGLWPAIAAFLREHREWRLLFYSTNNNGMTVLERAERRRNRSSPRLSAPAERRARLNTRQSARDWRESNPGSG